MRYGVPAVQKCFADKVTDNMTMEAAGPFDALVTRSQTIRCHIFIIVTFSTSEIDKQRRVSATDGW
jgi:hypothetical protein